MRQQAEGDTSRSHASAAPDHQQPLASDRGRYARNDQPGRERTVLHDQRVMIHDQRVGIHDQHLNDNQVAAILPPPLNRNSSDRDWSARIRASISRLMEIDGLCLDPDSYSTVAGKRSAAPSQHSSFHARVDRLQAASETAHKEYYSRLRGINSASTRKKMRLSLTATATESPPLTATSCQSRHEALDTLAVAAATEQLHTPQALTKSTTKKTKRSTAQNLPPERTEGTEQTRDAVHDPHLSSAMDKLMGKLAELLTRLHATPDSTAAEPILAAAASIALEATEMRRCELVALTRMAEIEEHRQKIMQGLLEYAKRKEALGSKAHTNIASKAAGETQQ